MRLALGACWVCGLTTTVVAVDACGSETTPGPVASDASATDTGSSGSSGSSGADSSSGGGKDATSGEGGTTSGGVGSEGCANNAVPCQASLKCCEGNPYPPTGRCETECTLKSDRGAKERFTRVDANAVLSKVVDLPLEEWSYIGERDVRHVGPMAQDFRAAFGLGKDDRSIHVVDASGVTLAAIQALHQRIVALEVETKTLREENKQLRSTVQKGPSAKSTKAHKTRRARP